MPWTATQVIDRSLPRPQQAPTCGCSGPPVLQRSPSLFLGPNLEPYNFTPAATPSHPDTILQDALIQNIFSLNDGELSRPEAAQQPQILITATNGEGYKNLSVAWKVPKRTVTGMLLKLKKSGITWNLPRKSKSHFLLRLTSVRLSTLLHHSL